MQCQIKELKYDSDGNEISDKEDKSEVTETDEDNSRSDISVFKVVEQEPQHYKRKP